MHIFSTVSETFISKMFPEKGDEISVRLASDTLLDEAVLRFDDYEGLESDDEMSYLGFHDNGAGAVFSIQMRSSHISSS